MERWTDKKRSYLNGTFPSRTNALSFIASQREELGGIDQTQVTDGETTVKRFGMYEQVSGTVIGQVIKSMDVLFFIRNQSLYTLGVMGHKGKIRKVWDLDPNYQYDVRPPYVYGYNSDTNEVVAYSISNNKLVASGTVSYSADYVMWRAYAGGIFILSASVSGISDGWHYDVYNPEWVRGYGSYATSFSSFLTKYKIQGDTFVLDTEVPISHDYDTYPEALMDGAGIKGRGIALIVGKTRVAIGIEQLDVKAFIYFDSGMWPSETTSAFTIMDVYDIETMGKVGALSGQSLYPWGVYHEVQNESGNPDDELIVIASFPLDLWTSTREVRIQKLSSGVYVAPYSESGNNNYSNPDIIVDNKGIMLIHNDINWTEDAYHRYSYTNGVWVKNTKGDVTKIMFYGGTEPVPLPIGFASSKHYFTKRWTRYPQNNPYKPS